MKKVFILLMFIITSYANAQQYMLPTNLVNQYIDSSSVGLDIIIETKLGVDNFYETTLMFDDKKKSFKLKQLVYTSFEVKLKKAINDVILAVINKDSIFISLTTPKDKNIIEKEIRLIFTKIVSYYNTEEERPEVATIYLKSPDSPIPVYKNKKGKDSIYTFVNELEDVSVELSFYGGFIEKIQVHGTINGTRIVFNNKYSMGISSTKNIRELDSYKLFSDNRFNKSEIEALTENAKQDNAYNYDKNKVSLIINVSDVIRYVKKVDVNANDVSPVKQLILLDENENESKLYREESSKLFEAVVYTDFLGLFEEENPNGIIQTEVNKRFNLNTKRSDVNKLFGFLFPPVAISEGYGFVQYFDAGFQYTKIESSNKFVKPSQFKVLDENNQVTDSIAYYSPISLFQNRNFSIGGILNLVSLENQNAKLNMYLNAGFYFGRTGLIDNNNTDGFYTNNLEIPMEYQFHILPEKRVSFMVSDRLSWFETFDSNINLMSIENNLLTSKNRWLNSFNIDLNVDVSSNGRLFLRYKLTHELDNIDNNFSRLQFGYSFYLLKNNGVNSKIKR